MKQESIIVYNSPSRQEFYESGLNDFLVLSLVAGVVVYVAWVFIKDCYKQIQKKLKGVGRTLPAVKDKVESEQK